MVTAAIRPEVLLTRFVRKTVLRDARTPVVLAYVLLEFRPNLFLLVFLFFKFALNGILEELILLEQDSVNLLHVRQFLGHALTL